ncbi:hypothetical protein DICVIV_00533 [Dictyocaulus viviparus]|uniref:Uncharacterized protein n=1 Tax=Dictyocaulus viviparus TaxID=29172 RepID=A0A0D8YAM6_DICVI|nr:hypothetical protein DICVIV_00533 [Dictyocaulus viviparus]
MTEVTRCADRGDTVLFITNDGVVPVSKSLLGVYVTFDFEKYQMFRFGCLYPIRSRVFETLLGTLEISVHEFLVSLIVEALLRFRMSCNLVKGVVPSRIDVTSLPKNAVEVFLRYFVINEKINEEVSIRDVATLIYLAEFYSINNILRQISECMMQASISNERSLCLCYNLSFVCNLHIKTQLAKLVAIKFDKMRSMLCELIEDSECLLPILQREQCVRLLNCTRKSLISTIDMQSLSSYVLEIATETMNEAWKSFVNNSSSSICWNSKHIMEKWSRCGTRREADSSLKVSHRNQLKHVTIALPVNDGDDDVNDDVTEHHHKETSSKRKCENVHGRTTSSTISKVTRKNLFVRGLLKLRQKFTRKSSN